MSAREVIAVGYGGPEQLCVREVDPPPLNSGEVRVDVRAAAVNAWDVKCYSGRFGDDPAALPLRLGSEVAGVTADGAEVICYPVTGGYADQVVAPVDNVLPKPPGLDWEAAAGLMLTGVAAAHLVAATGVRSGDLVLLHGAAGGVGLMAAQLCLHRGARVIGSALPQDHAVLRELGVEPLAISFDIRREELGAAVRGLAPAGVDVVLDAVGTETVLDSSVDSVRDLRRVATLVPSPAAAERGVQQLGFGDGADPGTELRRAARHDLLRGAGEGWLRVVVAATYPLSDADRAHRDLAGPHPAGKLVLVP